MAEEKKQKLIQRLRKKFRLIAFNDATFEEIWALRISKMKIILFWVSVFILLLGLSFVTISYTPIRELIPGYPKGSIRNQIVANSEKLDSLEYQIGIYEQYIQNLRTIISGGEPINYESDTSRRVYEQNIPFDIVEDSGVVQPYEFDQYEYSLYENTTPKKSLSSMHFFSPVKGYITNSFDPAANHFGTDIVADANEVVKATLGGTVIFSSWTVETGNVITIQHENDLISVYKHNAELLKEMGNHVEAGEAIAIIGNSGELTTGPHLHFELWHKGVPLNPEKYVSF
ncbi:MAG: M23 family metallopeptidase [Bacteroidales bacterium]|nr:M23 family metallopeptidase [Bacteroidales bacterium]